MVNLKNLKIGLNKRLLNILIPASRCSKKRLLIDLLLVAVVFLGVAIAVTLNGLTSMYGVGIGQLLESTPVAP